MTRPRSILVAGGGLGGLAAAVALRRAGMEVVVCERAGVLREVGSGLSVWPNATGALDAIGLLDAARARGAALDHLELRTWRGRLLSRSRLARGSRYPAICIHRADLLAVLKDGVPDECVRLGHELESFEEGDAEVRARFTSGALLRADALVGADGIRSRVRAALLGDGEPDYRGYHAWRGVAPCAHPGTDRATCIEFWGRGRRFGMEPMTGERTFWYATRNAPRGTLGDPSGWKDELRATFHGWPRAVTGLIEATPAEALLKHDIEDRPVRRHCGRGRVTLLGDAAHLTTPNLGQGACLALEDAAVLARCLAAEPDLAAAFRRYESGRYRRARFIVAESRRIGWIGQIEGRTSAALRDAFMWALPRFVNERQHRKCFAFRA